jgi:hypothetical protein
MYIFILGARTKFSVQAAQEMTRDLSSFYL